MKYVDYLHGELASHLAMFNALAPLFPAISEVGIAMQDCIKNGGKILICGNGGSADWRLCAEVQIRERSIVDACAARVVVGPR